MAAAAAGIGVSGILIVALRRRAAHRKGKSTAAMDQVSESTETATRPRPRPPGNP